MAPSLSSQLPSWRVETGWRLHAPLSHCQADRPLQPGPRSQRSVAGPTDKVVTSVSDVQLPCKQLALLCAGGSFRSSPFPCIPLQLTMERQLRLRAERRARKEQEARWGEKEALPEKSTPSSPSVPKAEKAQALHETAMAAARGARASSAPAEPTEHSEAQCAAGATIDQEQREDTREGDEGQFGGRARRMESDAALDHDEL
jgi:hypothetical protein